MADAVLQLARVSKSFLVDGARSRLRVLDDIDLSVAKGEFLSLVGPSGCGKTTLLKMMVGLIPCEEGEVVLRGKRMDGVAHDIGFVFQEPGLMPWHTLAANVDLALESKGMSRSARRAQVERYLQMTGLGEFANYPPYQLSGGMQHRGGIARALVGEPDVIFMDEPFVALDALTRGKLQTELAEIVGRTGTTSVLVTHDVDEALFLSDKVAVLSSRPGRILEVIEVTLPRPRQAKETRVNPAAIKLRDRILELIEGPPP